MKSMLAAVALAAALAVPAAAQVLYTINGMPTDPALTGQLAAMGLPPGHYWLLQNGTWGVMGSPVPMGNVYAGTYAGQGVYGGSGQINGDGSWSHYSPHVGGGGVGGDASGCVYAYGWSNC